MIGDERAALSEAIASLNNVDSSGFSALRSNNVFPKARSTAACPVRTHSRKSDQSSQRIFPATNNTEARWDP
jgi:hypothetical protein